jgi:transposase
MPRRSPFTIVLSDTEERVLVETSKRHTAPYYKVVRAKIILFAASGLENDQIARRLDIPRESVSKWRKRFFYEGLDGLQERPRCERPRSFLPSGHCGNQGPRL